MHKIPTTPVCAGSPKHLWRKKGGKAIWFRYRNPWSRREEPRRAVRSRTAPCCRRASLRIAFAQNFWVSRYFYHPATKASGENAVPRVLLLEGLRCSSRMVRVGLRVCPIGCISRYNLGGFFSWPVFTVWRILTSDLCKTEQLLNLKINSPPTAVIQVVIQLWVPREQQHHQSPDVVRFPCPAEYI